MPLILPKQQLAYFNPGRTLFVAKSWPAGVDPLIHFTNINTALIQAATMAPLAADNVDIVIFPGNYAENLTLVSNVNLYGLGNRGVRPLGNITWTPGAGINVGSKALREDVGLYNLRMTSASTFTDNRTAKTGNASVIDMRDCSTPNWTFTPRPAGFNDTLQAYDTIWGNLTAVAGAGVVITSACDFLGTIFNIGAGNDCVFEVGSLFPNVNIQGPANTANTTWRAIDFLGNMNQFGTGVYMGCYLRGTLTVSPGGLADILASECPQANLVLGSGPIDRRIMRRTTGVTVAGVPLNIVFDPPLSDAQYSVSLSQITGTPAVPLITAKTALGFVLTDAVGGNTFDLTISKD